MADIPEWLRDLLRGASQGATLGFGDEGSGALGALQPDVFEGERASERGLGGAMDERSTYERARDEVRGENREAQERSPWAYGAGQIAGTMPLAVAGGAGMVGALGAPSGAAAIGSAAALEGGVGGMIQGLGSSEAEDVRGMIDDTVMGGQSGAAGGAIAAPVAAGGRELVRHLGRVASRGLPRRVAENVFEEMGVNPAQARRQNSLVEDADVLRTARGRPTHEIQSMADEAMSVDPHISIFDDAEYYRSASTPQGAPSTALDDQITATRARLERPEPNYTQAAQESNARYTAEGRRQMPRNQAFFDEVNEGSFNNVGQHESIYGAGDSSYAPMSGESSVPSGAATNPQRPSNVDEIGNLDTIQDVGSLDTLVGERPPSRVGNPDIRPPRDRAVPGPRPPLYDQPSGRPLGEVGPPGAIMRDEVNRPSGEGARMLRQRMQGNRGPEDWSRTAAGENMRNTSRIMPGPVPQAPMSSTAPILGRAPAAQPPTQAPEVNTGNADPAMLERFFDAETGSGRNQLRNLQRQQAYQNAPRPQHDVTPQPTRQSELLQQAADYSADRPRPAEAQSFYQGVMRRLHTPGVAASVQEAVTPLANRAAGLTPANDGRWTRAVNRATLGARPPESPMEDFTKPPAAPKDLFDPEAVLDAEFDADAILDAEGF